MKIIITYLIFYKLIFVATFNTTEENATKLKCPELFSTSLNINCVFENKTISCDEPMPHKTTAILECKDHYYTDFLPYNEIICEKTQWSMPLFNCKPICGRRTPKGTPMVVKGSKAEVGDFPWHVGLFEKVNWNTRRYICGGSIISPKLVLTAAHCFLVIEPRRYDVTAGNYYREWKHNEDQNAQYRDVTEIIISDKYGGQLTSFTADIAILVVDRVFILSDLIQPVCLNFNKMAFEKFTAIFGEVPGWGLTSEGGELSDFLQYTTLPLISRKKCLKSVPDDFTLFVTIDKICAGYTNGTNVCEGDSGGGLVHRRENDKNGIKYYIIGVVSTSPFKEDSCDSYQYSTFTIVANYIDWINETMFKYESWSPYDYGCPLPDPPSFGTYIIIENMYDIKEMKPGNIVPHYTKLKYLCNENYEIYGPEIITCKNKKWNDNIVFAACYKTCSDLVPPEFISSDIYIRYSSKKLKNGGFLHETRAFFNCIDRKSYELEEPQYNQTTCRDGNWMKPILKCIPVCGLKNEQNKTDPIDEDVVEDAYEGKYPWHAAIYKKTANNFEFKTAGTILSPFVLIIDKYAILNDSLDNYIVVAGNIHLSVNLTHNKNIQISPIFKIIKIRETIYYSYYTTLIILKNRLNITSSVRPVCLNQKYILDETGYVEIPMWLDGNNDLKNLKLIFERTCNEHGCSTAIIDTNKIHFINGQMVKSIKVGSETKYYIMSQSVTRVYDKIFIHLLDNYQRDLIQKHVDAYNIESNMMSECVVSNILSHGHIAEYPLNVEQVLLETSKITFICDLPHYALNNSKQMICRNGSWISLDGIPPTCVECGVSELQINLNDKDIGTKGLSAQQNDFPWNVGIYDKRNIIPQLICGGTIVSSRVVLSAAQCFPGKKSYSKKNTFAIGAGKFFNDWNNTLDVHAQYIDIDNITYFGMFEEIGIAVLAKHLNINSFVSPPCLSTSTNLTNINMSLIMPFWINDSENSSEINTGLKYIKFNLDNEEISGIKNSSIYCPNDEYWKRIKGNAAVQFFSNETKRYLLRSIFIEVDCDRKTFLFANIDAYKEIIDIFIKRYNK